MALSLTTEEIRCIRAAQRALLAPLEYDRLKDWQRHVNQRIRRVINCEHTVFVYLDPPNSHIFSDDTVDDVLGELRSQFSTPDRSSEPDFQDDLLIQSWKSFMAAGPAALHERELTSRETVEQSSFFNSVFRPHGIRHMLGLAVLRRGGFIMTAFEEPSHDDYSERGVQKLDLLVPAFTAGLKGKHKLTRQRATFAAAVDALDVALEVVGENGRVLHRNSKLLKLLRRESESAMLTQAMNDIASRLHFSNPTNPKTASHSPICSAVQVVATTTSVYEITACHPPIEGLDGAKYLIVVSRQSPFAHPSVIQERYGLTSRETEVTYLIAEGASNEEIAKQLYISAHTARHHVQHVLEKLDLHNRSGVARKILPGAEQVT